MSITFHSTCEFRRLATPGNTAAKLADNEGGSTGYRYSSTPFQGGKGMPSSFYVPPNQMDTYKAFIFYGFLDSPPPVRNNTFSFLLLSFYSPPFTAVLPSSEILDGDLTAPQCWPWIQHLWITVFFSSTLIFLLTWSLILPSFSWIETGDETGSPSDILGASLAVCGTIISSLNWSPSIPLTKALFLVF